MRKKINRHHLVAAENLFPGFGGYNTDFYVDDMGVRMTICLPVPMHCVEIVVILMPMGYQITPRRTPKAKAGIISMLATTIVIPWQQGMSTKLLIEYNKTFAEMRAIVIKAQAKYWQSRADACKPYVYYEEI